MSSPLFASCTVAVLLLVSVATAVQTVPPLPYAFFQTWTVLTETWVNAKGNATEHSSYGFHTVVNNASSGVLCRHGIDLLYPQVPTYTTTIVSNYTMGSQWSRDMNDNGTVSDCALEVLDNGSMPFAGAWFLGPRRDIQDAMFISSYAMSGGYNCSVWEWVGQDADGNRQIVQWFVAVESNIPQALVNQTFYSVPFSGDYVSRILTTAYVGYEPMYEWPEPCVAPNSCGGEYCAAVSGAGDAALQSALSWVCGSGGINCDDISIGGPDYYPNSIVAHASWAFNQYYTDFVAEQGSAACNFNGAATLTTCSNMCTLCNASRTADPTALANALAWVCADGNIDCSAITNGGSRFLPNTTQNHADYAFNEYYQGYRCVPPQAAACDFNGTGVVVPCPSGQ